MFKTFLNLFGNVFGLFEEKWKFFHFSDLFPSLDPPACTGQNFFPVKYLKTSSTLVWKLLRTFLDTFRNSIFFDFIFRISTSFDLQAALVKKSSEKNTSKKFGHFWKRFSGFWKIEFFFHFLKFFDFSTLQGALGEFFYRKKYLEACWKHVWTLLGTYLGILKKWKFSSFLKFFTVWTFQGALGNFFWENYLKTSLKFVWTLLGPFLDTFEVSNFCRFFFEFFQVSTLQGALVNFLTKKLPRSMFKRFLNLFGNVFGLFEEKWNFFHFSDHFPSFDPPACTGQNFFPEKYLKTI